MNEPKCFGNKKENKIKFYTDLKMSYELSKTMLSKICRGCKYNNKCCKKIINGNGFNSIHKLGRKKKREFDGYKCVGEKK